jgi:hypothetical protein
MLVHRRHLSCVNRIVESAGRPAAAARGMTVRSRERKYLWKSGSFHPENVKKQAKRQRKLES